jgi:hemerythrin-like metal-binding protein
MKKILAQDKNWIKWVMQTASVWGDIDNIVRLTGLDVIDNDHRQMAYYALEINKLVDVYEKDGFSLDYLKKQESLFDNLYHYTRRHFKREERIMRRYAFTDLANHIKLHDGILKSLGTTIEDFKSGRVTVSMNLKLAILDWVVGHINDVDYNEFQLDNWNDAITQAQTKDDISILIKSTGHFEIDEEHLLLIDYTIAFIQSITDLIIWDFTTDEKEKSGSELDITQTNAIKSLDKIILLIKKHFGREEQMMKKYNLSGSKSHLEQHQYFTDILIQYKFKIKNLDLEFTDELKLSIIKWWMNHINTIDFETFGQGNWPLIAVKFAGSWDEIERFVKKTELADIDEDHKQLTSSILRLSQAIDNLEQEESDLVNLEKKVVTALRNTMDITRDHFNREEEYLIRIQSSDLERQKHEHKKYNTLLEKYYVQFTMGQIKITPNTKNSILEWIIKHINNIDYNTFGPGAENIFDQ